MPSSLSVNGGMPRDVPWQGRTVHAGTEHPLAQVPGESLGLGRVAVGQPDPVTAHQGAGGDAGRDVAGR